MNIPGYKTHRSCPITPGCTSKQVFESDETGKFWSLVADGRDFIPHECRVRGSMMPEVAYLGKWYNTRSGRTRWIGPERLERSVRKPPIDVRYTAEDWELKGIKISKLDWQNL